MAFVMEVRSDSKKKASCTLLSLPLGRTKEVMHQKLRDVATSFGTSAAAALPLDSITGCASVLSPVMLQLFFSRVLPLV